MSERDDKNKGPLDFEQMASLKHWGPPPRSLVEELDKQAIVDCGWGRLIFAQTFHSNAQLVEQLRKENPGRRDIALYSRDPQVVVSQAPQELFIDPSLTYRLELKNLHPIDPQTHRFGIRALAGADDEHQINRIYMTRSMVPVRERFFEYLQEHSEVLILVAVDNESGQVIGCVTGVDHYRAFGDPDNGSSLWALAVDPQCPHAGVGEALSLALAEHFKTEGRDFMDLSVMHDNTQAIRLYEKLGFVQVPVYCIKNKNAINVRLYAGSKTADQLNIYARIIVVEANRRGIAVDIVDAAGGFFDLKLGGRSISCRESLTDLTSAVAMSRCDDKAVTRRFLARAGLNVPEQELLSDREHALAFLQRYRRIVIKPARGEQGQGVSVDLRTPEQALDAYSTALNYCDAVLAERFVEGGDLRIIVINDEVVAAAIRKPASIMGDGVHTITELIRKQSRRRSAATQGESAIPMDAETKRCVADAGFDMDRILPYGQRLQVRKTANLHTGGTLHDVTAKLHAALIDAALRGARALKMPLVGFDFIVPSLNDGDYVIIEANERPGLANHEPQPTAEKLIDMLFPQTIVNNKIK